MTFFSAENSAYSILIMYLPRSDYPDNFFPPVQAIEASLSDPVIKDEFNQEPLHFVQPPKPEIHRR